MLWAIAFGGATGSVSRYLVSLWLTREHGAFPVGTFVINVVGSFLIAVFARIFSTPDSNQVLRAALTIGFCGGFTTFSTFSAEFVTLVQEGRTLRAVVYVTLSVLSGVLAVVAGLALGNRFISARP
jgi:fluoride exporter